MVVFLPKGKLRLVLMVVAFACVGLRADEEPSRPRVPDAEAVAAAQKTARELFKADYAKHTPADRQALVHKLLDAAAESSGDAVARYTLLREARDVAASAGDVDEAFDVAGKIGEQFAVDPLEAKADALNALNREVLGPDDRQTAAVAALRELTRALEAGDVDGAAKLSVATDAAAAKVHWGALNTRLAEKDKELRELRTAHDRVAPAEAALKKNPDDADANTAVGKYLCFQRHDWEKGLEHLGKGSDAELKKLADADLGAGADADAQVERGDAWWKYAVTQPGPAKAAVEQRAAYWYALAMPTLPAPKRVALEGKMKQAETDERAANGRTGLGDADPRQVEAGREIIEKEVTLPVESKTLAGNVTFAGQTRPYRINRTLQLDGDTTLKFAPGAEIRDGTVQMGGSGHVVAKGDKHHSVIFRRVHFNQDLGASLDADYAIFDQCTFNKTGAWYSAFSSKWTFNHCILYRCKFGGLSEVDYGFQFRHCALASMDFPEIGHGHGRDFNSKTALRQEWNTIEACDFLDCTVPPTVCWSARQSNFRACRFLAGEAYNSPDVLDDPMYVADTVGPPPQRAWDVNPAHRAAAHWTLVSTPFETVNYSEFDTLLPEVISNGAQAGVAFSHFKDKPGKK